MHRGSKLDIAGQNPSGMVAQVIMIHGNTRPLAWSVRAVPHVEQHQLRIAMFRLRPSHAAGTMVQNVLSQVEGCHAAACRPALLLSCVHDVGQLAACAPACVCACACAADGISITILERSRTFRHGPYRICCKSRRLLSRQAAPPPSQRDRSTCSALSFVKALFLAACPLQ